MTTYQKDESVPALDDLPEFQRYVNLIGKMSADPTVAGAKVLEYWQGLNYIIEKWEKSRYVEIQHS